MADLTVVIGEFSDVFCAFPRKSVAIHSLQIQEKHLHLVRCIFDELCSSTIALNSVKYRETEYVYLCCAHLALHCNGERFDAKKSGFLQRLT